MAVGNLELVKTVTVSSGVSSVSITDVFTSKYEVYKATFTNLNGTVAGGSYSDFRFLDSGGSEISTANYDYASLLLTTYTSFSEFKATSSNEFDRFLHLFSYTGTGESVAGEVWFFNPFSSSSYTFFLGQSMLQNVSGNGIGTKNIGVLKDTSSLSGYKLYLQTASRYYENFEISTYGLASN